MAIYDIDLLRQLFVDKLNDNTIFLASFYEQIQDEQQIERYVETIKELLSLQNREKSVSNYKAMGIIAQSGNAEIINIKQNYISPLEYQARFDIELTDRDYVLGKLKTLINDLRGRKFDMLLGVSGTAYTTEQPLSFNGVKPVLRNNMFVRYSADYNWQTESTDLITDLKSIFHFEALSYVVYMDGADGDTLSGLYKLNIGYAGGVHSLTSFQKLENSFTRYKLSLSFDGIQSQEPYINNGVDRVFLFFGGSATVVESNVSLGNDIILHTIQVGDNEGDTYTVEPTEIPASLSVSDDTFQTYANGYRTTDRNLAIGNKMAYSFIYDTTNTLYNDLYAYARFGVAVTPSAIILPQQIFTIKEYRYSFGLAIINTFYAKLGDVATSNTNGDVMTISVNFKIGDY
jgi:hypothetical protein